MEIKTVENAIYKWGVYPALVLLRELQDEEEYELCAVVKCAIDNIMNGREYGISTLVDDKNLQKSYEIVIGQFQRKAIIKNNMPFYIDEFKKCVI